MSKMFDVKQFDKRPFVIKFVRDMGELVKIVKYRNMCFFKHMLYSIIQVDTVINYVLLYIILLFSQLQ